MRQNTKKLVSRRYTRWLALVDTPLYRPLQVRDALAVRDFQIPCSRPETPTTCIPEALDGEDVKDLDDEDVDVPMSRVPRICLEATQRSSHGISGLNSEDSVSRFENGPLELVLGDVQD